MSQLTDQLKRQHEESLKLPEDYLHHSIQISNTLMKAINLIDQLEQQNQTMLETLHQIEHITRIRSNQDCVKVSSIVRHVLEGINV